MNKDLIREKPFCWFLEQESHEGHSETVEMDEESVERQKARGYTVTTPLFTLSQLTAYGEEVRRETLKDCLADSFHLDKQPGNPCAGPCIDQCPACLIGEQLRALARKEEEK
jgi:hypothetical protein